MSFVFVKRKYGGTKVGKAIAITEDNKATIKTEAGVDVTIEENGYAVVPHDGGYVMAKVGDYFISYTSTEGKSDSDVIAADEYATLFEAVSALKKPDPAGLVRAAGFVYPGSEGSVPEVITHEPTFKASKAKVSASLDESNNDAGHVFILGTIEYKGEDTGTFTLSMTDKSLATYKLKLKETTVTKSASVQVEAILQRARKDQKAAVKHTCPITLTVDGKEFKFNIEVDIAEIPQT